MTTTLITGATGGIGLELARIYQQRGDKLILIGRRDLTALTDPLFTEATYIQADLAAPDAAEIIDKWLQNHNITQIDRLIHNAGLGYFGIIEEQPPENITELTAVNLRAPVAITHKLLPCLKASNGKIVFISSVVAALPAADYAVYAATKAALDAFAYNLRIELQERVAVQVIHPGATRTDMHRKAGITEADMDTSKFPLPETVAAQIARVIDSNQKQVAIGAANKLMRWAGKHAARLIDTAMKGKSR